MKTRKYFVSYNWIKNNENGSACNEIETKRKIKSFEDIRKITDHIKKENSYDGAVILFWKEF